MSSTSATCDHDCSDGATASLVNQQQTQPQNPQVLQTSPRVTPLTTSRPTHEVKPQLPVEDDKQSNVKSQTSQSQLLPTQHLKLRQLQPQPLQPRNLQQQQPPQPQQRQEFQRRKVLQSYQVHVQSAANCPSTSTASNTDIRRVVLEAPTAAGAASRDVVLKVSEADTRRLVSTTSSLLIVSFII